MHITDDFGKHHAHEIQVNIADVLEIVRERRKGSSIPYFNFNPLVLSFEI
jgi:hypothetical protein